MTDAIAASFGADDDKITITRNTIDAMLSIINGLNFEYGDVILTIHHEHVAAISILAFPVFMGLYCLMRINKANIILHTEIELSTKQQTILAEQELVHQANHDSLTQLPNRSCSQNRLILAINHSQRDNTQILTMFINLDNFKQINNTLGHGAEDQIIQQTSKQLISSVRNTDTVARLEGDEFYSLFLK
ncbi:MAG: PleD family two-component response regulator [Psychromonas sp.]|jgi:PleD family two-component response regulator